MAFVIAFKNVSRYFSVAGFLALCLVCMSGGAFAQSTDITAPTPVRTNDVSGAIAPRDIGDARLTDHFFAFIGTPGDLLITIEGRNLNGDVDVFTASGLRPLLKFSLYAGSGSPVTKSIYLRRREDLIIRVEARSPNDDAGSYRIRFGGSFEPIAGGSFAEAETSPSELPTPTITFGAKKGRRVSSVGARIEEPAPTDPEIAAAPALEPTAGETKAEEPPPPAATEEEPAVTRAPARTPRRRRVPGRRTRTPQPASPEEPAATSESETKAPAEEVAESEPAPRGRRRGSTGRNVGEPTQEPEPESGPRLIIETNDGTLINRYMSTVRRVIVENGQVVVVGKDGKIQRVALASVTKMSISP